MFTSFPVIFFVIIMLLKVLPVMPWSNLSCKDYMWSKLMASLASYPIVETHSFTGPSEWNGSWEDLAPVFTRDSCRGNVPLIHYLAPCPNHPNWPPNHKLYPNHKETTVETRQNVLTSQNGPHFASRMIYIVVLNKKKIHGLKSTNRC